MPRDEKRSYKCRATLLAHIAVFTPAPIPLVTLFLVVVLAIRIATAFIPSGVFSRTLVVSEASLLIPLSPALWILPAVALPPWVGVVLFHLVGRPDSVYISHLDCSFVLFEADVCGTGLFIVVSITLDPVTFQFNVVDK
jgi:hypothetical protein